MTTQKDEPDQTLPTTRGKGFWIPFALGMLVVVCLIVALGVTIHKEITASRTPQTISDNGDTSQTAGLNTFTLSPDPSQPAPTIIGPALQRLNGLSGQLSPAVYDGIESCPGNEKADMIAQLRICASGYAAVEITNGTITKQQEFDGAKFYRVGDMSKNACPTFNVAPGSHEIFGMAIQAKSGSGWTEWEPLTSLAGYWCSTVRLIAIVVDPGNDKPSPKAPFGFVMTNNLMAGLLHP